MRSTHRLGRNAMERETNHALHSRGYLSPRGRISNPKVGSLSMNNPEIAWKALPEGSVGRTLGYSCSKKSPDDSTL